MFARTVSRFFLTVLGAAAAAYVALNAFNDIQVTGGVILPDGATGTPSLRFTTDQTMGAYKGLDPNIGTFQALVFEGGVDTDIVVGRPGVDFVTINAVSGFWVGAMTLEGGPFTFCNAAASVCGLTILDVGASTGKFAFDLAEGATAGTATAGSDVFYADSTSHGFLASYNNSAFSLILRNLDLGTHLNAPSSFTTGSCTAESQSTNSSEFDGDITATCLAADTWILVFTTTYTTAPHCTISAMNATAAAGAATFTYTTSTTALTATVTTAATTGKWAYHCFK